MLFVRRSFPDGWFPACDQASSSGISGLTNQTPTVSLVGCRTGCAVAHYGWAVAHYGHGSLEWRSDADTQTFQEVLSREADAVEEALEVAAHGRKGIQQPLASHRSTVEPAPVGATWTTVTSITQPRAVRRGPALCPCPLRRSGGPGHRMAGCGGRRRWSGGSSRPLLSGPRSCLAADSGYLLSGHSSVYTENEPCDDGRESRRP